MSEKCLKEKSLVKKNISIHNKEKTFNSDNCILKYSLQDDVPKDVNMVITANDSAVIEEASNSSVVSKHVNYTEGEVLMCKICSTEFLSKRKFQQHLSSHSRGKRYVCKVCSQRFSNNGHLTVHLRNHTNEKPFICNICSKRFTSSSYLKIHLNSHTKPFTCDICSRRYSQKEYLNEHLRSHTGEKPFICEVCTKAFSRKRDLKLHFRSHTDEKPFLCKICSKRFSRKGNLNIHLRSHCEEKPFVCEICAKAFSYKISLDIHIATHTGEKPFTCEVCCKRFSNKSNLKQHFGTHLNKKQKLKVSSSIVKNNSSNILCNTLSFPEHLEKECEITLTSNSRKKQDFQISSNETKTDVAEANLFGIPCSTHSSPGGQHHEEGCKIPSPSHKSNKRLLVSSNMVKTGSRSSSTTYYTSPFLGQYA